MSAFKRLRLTNIDGVGRAVHPAPARQRVERAASQRVESTATIPSFVLQRWAPAPGATPPPSPASTRSAGGGSSRPTVPTGLRSVSRLRPYPGRRGSTPRWAGRGRLPPRRLGRCMAAARPRTRAKSAPSRLPLLLTHTISSLAGTCALAAELASGVGSTARIPGLAPAATGADAGLLAVRGGRANGLTIGGSGPHFRYFCEEAIMQPCASAGGSAANHANRPPDFCLIEIGC